MVNEIYFSLFSYTLLPPMGQSVTEQGEVYFIHHQTKKRTWFDPRIPIASQQPLKHGQSDDALSQTQEHQRRLAEIRIKQQELRKKEYIRTQLMRQTQRPRSASQENVAQAQEMMMRHSLSDGTPGHTSIDPFLGQGNPGEAHNRQESADSGLGMGSNFNLGSIPEDMGLENMDTADLDTTLTESSIQGQQQQQGMETEELIPTLPELGDELSNDIMQTILNPNKVENDSHIWL
jgi:protein yorkie